MTSAVYQATIEELEAILSPRVVSRSLQEGLQSVGKSPQNVAYADLEKILKAQVYRQLQVAMPVTEAKTRVADILDKLKQLEADEITRSEVGKTLEQQASSLSFLKDRLKPFNLYFEWSEVQKLRALVQLLDAEHTAGREANKLVNDARDQLRLVEQKLEDQLVRQAQELASLEATFKLVQSLGGPKLRRFENLINQINESQESRQLAQAEIERATKLSLDLRKLMESSIVVESTVTASSTKPNSVTQEASTSIQEPNQEDIEAKLLELDLANEAKSLAALKENTASLLEFRTDLAEPFLALEAKLAQKQKISSDLEALEQQLITENKQLRQSLLAELESMETVLASLHSTPADLSQDIQISLGILEMALPSLRDIEHLRRLYALAVQKDQEQQQQLVHEETLIAGQLAEQESLLSNLTERLQRYQTNTAVFNEINALQSCLAVLSEAQENGQVQPHAVNTANEAMQALQQAVAKHAASELERSQAQLSHLQGLFKSLPRADVLNDAYLDLDTQLNDAFSLSNALSKAELSALKQNVAAYKNYLLDYYKDVLKDFKRQAQALNDRDLLEQFETAQVNLTTSYPNLDALAQLLKHAQKQKQSEHINDLHNLENELNTYSNAPSDLVQPLATLITQAQAALAQGEIIHLDEAWGLVDVLRQDNERRGSSFVPRLDKSLADFMDVAKLNTEEANKAGRLLDQLRIQRDNFDRLSVSMQQSLENSLSESEQLIAALKEQLAATKAIAGQLVSSNLLDNLFGGSSTTANEPLLFDLPEEPQTNVLRSSSEVLNQWVDAYKDENSVKSVMIFEQGSLVAGHGDLDLSRLSDALLQLDFSFTELGDELSLGKKHLSIVELSMHSAISAWLSAEHQLILLLDQPAQMNAIVHRLRQDLPILNQNKQNATST